MTEEERAQVLEEWNQTEREYPEQSVRARVIRGAGGADAGSGGGGVRRGAD